MSGQFFSRIEKGLLNMLRARRLNLADALYFCVCSAVFALILFSDFLPLPVDSYSSQRMFLLLALSGSVCVALVCVARGTVAVGWWFVVDAIVLVSIWALLISNVAGQSSSRFGLSEAAMYGALFSSFVLSGHVFRSSSYLERAWQIFLPVAAVACFFYAMMTLTVYAFAILDGQRNLVPYIPWGFVSMRYWSHIATWVLPILPLALLIGPFRKSALWRVGVFLSMSVWWWIVLLSSARGTTSGIAFGLLFVMLLFGRASFPWAKGLVKGLLGGFLVWGLLSFALPELLFGEAKIRGLKTDNSDRVPQVLEAWAMSLENFPLGMGAQSWLTHDLLTPQYDATKKFGHPHNMYLLWAAEYGWLFLALVLILVLGGAARFFTRKRELFYAGESQGSLKLAALTASVSAALFHAGVSAVFMAPASMLVAVFVFAIFWGEIQIVGPERAVTERKGKRTVSLVAASLSLFFLAFSALWAVNVSEYYRAMISDRSYYYDSVSKGHLPRFWFHGYFPRRPSEMPENNQ